MKHIGHVSARIVLIYDKKLGFWPLLIKVATLLLIRKGAETEFFRKNSISTDLVYFLPEKIGLCENLFPLCFAFYI